MERDLIAKIAHRPKRQGQESGLLLGIGDDCAAASVQQGKELLLTTDTLVESVHFDLAYFDPYDLGRKTAAVNLSDIAAMGGSPKWALLNIAVRKGLPSGFWDRFSDGLWGMLQDFGATLVGGDTVSSPVSLVITLTLAGEVPSGKRLERSGARAGDVVYCSGFLGEASAGLSLLKAQGRQRAKNILVPRGVRRRLSRRHLTPEPRVRLGRELSSSGMVSAAIDLSDGIATDLAHICSRSGVRAVLDSDRIPLSRSLLLASKGLGVSAMELALSGGEDFELLWTVPREKARDAERVAASVLGHPPFRLGKIEEGKGVFLKTRDGLKEITFLGYEHRI